jgi:polysaccharide export outer membrane protein
LHSITCAVSGSSKFSRHLLHLSSFAATILLLAMATQTTNAQEAISRREPANGAAKSQPAAGSGNNVDLATPSKTRPSQITSPITPDTYRIGLADSLTISVWHEPELSSGVVVRPDGMITLPLINDVHVVGLEPIELQQLLTEKLKPFVSDPQVTVIVTAIKSRKVSLVGQVLKQGVYPLDGGETLLELLAAAGGLGPFAKTGSIYVLRTENGKQVRIPFKYKKALQAHVGDADIVLEPGDVVVVP